MVSSSVKKQLYELCRYPKEIGGIIEDDTVKILYLGGNTDIDLDWTGEAEILFHTHPHHNDPPSPQDIIFMLTGIIGDLAHIVFDSYHGIEHGEDTYLSVKKYLVASLDGIYIYYPSQRLIDSLLEDLYTIYSENFSKDVSDMIDQISERCSNYLTRCDKSSDSTYDQFKSKLNHIGVEIDMII